MYIFMALRGDKRSPLCYRRSAFKPWCFQIQLGSKRIDHAYRVVFGDEVIQALRQQSHLLPVLTFDVSGHMTPSVQYVC